MHYHFLFIYFYCPDKMYVSGGFLNNSGLLKCRMFFEQYGNCCSWLIGDIKDCLLVYRV